MRYKFSCDQLLFVYLMVSLAFKIFNCQHACDEMNLNRANELVFERESHEYSHYYYYSRLIRLNQPSPFVNGTFEKLVTDELQRITPKFSFKFYGSDVTRLVITKYGSIEIYGETFLGAIDHYVPDIISSECEISNDKNVFAHRLSFQISDLNGTFKVTTLIHSNGKISFYYDNVPWGYENYYSRSQIFGLFECGEEDQRDVGIYFDAKWVKSGTLVEFEVSGDCEKHNSIETCQNSTTSNTCFWCKVANRCIVDNNKDIHDFKVNGCQIVNSLSVNLMKESTHVEQAKTTSSIMESELIDELKKTDQVPESDFNSSSVNLLSTPTLVERTTTTSSIRESELIDELKKTDQVPESDFNSSSVNLLSTPTLVERTTTTSSIRESELIDELKKTDQVPESDFNSSSVNLLSTPTLVERTTTTSSIRESELIDELKKTDQVPESDFNSSSVNLLSTPTLVERTTTTSSIRESELIDELKKTDQVPESDFNSSSVNLLSTPTLVERTTTTSSIRESELIDELKKTDQVPESDFNSSSVNLLSTPTLVERTTTTSSIRESELIDELKKTDQVPESDFNSSSVNLLSTPTLVERTTTTSSIRESELIDELKKTDQVPESDFNMTTEMTGGNEPGKKSPSLHIVIR
ncbi:unnamed protein product [Schistosoma rodhaini]|uniref:Farnesoic acid O-methyl transferase domain-containing protein n=1 Tax=Schistosoma rodhaini TaxID=6188 RepID=A0AA85G0A3_9TREM|nr:unnamed protein product [Schistosoma rodhaini]